MILGRLILIGLFFTVSCTHKSPVRELATSETVENLEQDDTTKACKSFDKFIIAVHVGTGSSLRQEFLSKILGEAKLKTQGGAKSLDVVEFLVSSMENSGMYNAGRGAISNRQGQIELDASIMSGLYLRAGMIAGVSTLRNPVSAAKLIMLKSPHVFMIGKGAEDFASKAGAEIINPDDYYRNIRRPASLSDKESYGTVGAVALDRCGNLAAATSSGGWNRKLPGRVGDSAIVGASTYANNLTCAVSTTGRGEEFIRTNLSHDLSNRIEFKKLSLADAAEETLEKLTERNGIGGFIAIDASANFVSKNNMGFGWAYVKNDTKVVFER